MQKSTRLVEMIANLDVSQKEEIKQLLASSSSVTGDGSSRSSSHKSDYSAPWQQVVDILAQSDAQSSKEERQSLVEDLSSDSASWRMLRDCILEASQDGEATSGKSTRSLDSSTKEVLMAWADSSSDKITENRSGTSNMQSNSGVSAPFLSFTSIFLFYSCSYLCSLLEDLAEINLVTRLRLSFNNSNNYLLDYNLSNCPTNCSF